MLGAKIGIGDLLDKAALNRIRGAMEDAGLSKEEITAMDVW
jgi:hypothetical protein